VANSPDPFTDMASDAESATGRATVAIASRSPTAPATILPRVLRRLLRGASTVLIVPVRSADDIRHHSAREAGMPAHITIMYPFLRARAIDGGTERQLASIAEEVPAFDFTLSKIGRFLSEVDGVPRVVYLAPEPAAPFIMLTEAVMREWPDQRPYGGAFEEIVPHLTVAYGHMTPGGVGERVPLDARADELWLMKRFGNRWVRRRRFALGRAVQTGS
jgi:2'-5' RNA ligase